MLTINSPKENVMKLTHPCRCSACENTCRYGSGALVEDDLHNIAEFLNKSEEEIKEKYLEKITKFNTTLLRPKLLREYNKPYGKCIFYDEVDGCTVHQVKPLECKIAMGCKDYGEELIIWFNLKHYLNRKDVESLRQFKIYLDSGGKTLPGAEFKDVFNKKTLKMLKNYEDLEDKTDWDEVLGLKNEKRT
jgi:hypothetical protein